jgi:hypothetical protein
MQKIKVFKFIQNEHIDLTHTPEFGCNVIQCGRDKYTISNFKAVEGHDDSLPYNAVLCLNDKPICKCSNTGWGEQTEIKPISIQSEAIIASARMKLSKYGWSFRGGEFDLTLDFIADTLALSASKGFGKI